MPERKQTKKKADSKKSKKQMKVKLRDLRPSKDAKGGLDTIKDDWSD